MKMHVTIICIFVLLSAALSAENWKYQSNFNLSLTQNAYSNNWAGTELGSISWASTSNTTADKQISDLILSKNTLKLAFGQTHSQKLDAMGKRYWDKPEKTTDKIDFETIFRFTLHAYVDPFISGRMESQFVDFSDPAKTRMLNPSQFTEAAGMARTIITNEDHTLNTRLGAAVRQRVDRDKLNTVTMERKTTTESDAGIEFVAVYNQIYKPKELTFNSRLQIFQALYNSKSKDLNNDWKTTDFTWENTFGMKIYKVITLNLYLEMLYNKEQEKAVQFKETLGLGIAFQLL